MPERVRALPRAATIAALSLGLSLPTAGQGRPSGSAAATDQPAPPPIRTLFGDVALVLRRPDDATLAIGASGPRRTLTLSVRTSDARRWADSAARLLTPARRRTAAPRGAPGGRGGASLPNDSVPIVRRSRVVLEEPGVGAGSFVLTRVDSAGERAWLLFLDDAELDPLRQPLVDEEAATLVRLMRRAATVARATPRRPPARRTPVPSRGKAPPPRKPAGGG